MTDTTPDYAELIAEAEAAQEWMRQPDWADNFSLGDLEGWLRQRPTSILPRITSALRTLLERNAALERDAWRKECEKLSTVWAENHSRNKRAEEAEARVKELEARLAEADRVIEPFAEYLDDGFDLDYEGRPLPDSNTLGWVYLTLGHLRAARAYREKGSTPHD